MTQTTQFDWMGWGLHADWQQFQTIQGNANEQIYKDELAKQPRFVEEGHPDLTIIYIGMEEDRFEEGKQALCLYLFDKQTGRGDFYQMSLSDSYVQDRNNTGVRKTGYQSTVEKLAKLGFQGGDNFLQFAAEYFGKTVPCWVKAVTSRTSNNTYYVIGALGSGGFTKPVMPWNFVRPSAPAAPAPQMNYQTAPAQMAPAPQNPPAVNALGQTNPYNNMAPTPQQAFQQPVQVQAAPPMPQGIPANNPFGN